MYKLTFKGRDLEPLFLDDEKGKIVMDAYLQNKSVRLVANNQAFNTGDIKSIFLVEKSRSEMAQSTTSQEQEYLNFREKMLSLSLIERSNIIRIPKVIWRALSDSEMPDDVKVKIKERQLAYFEANPNCIYANPAIYQDLMPTRTERQERDGIKPIKSLLPTAMLRVIEEQIRTDIQYSLIGK